MDRLLTKLRLKRKARIDTKSLPKNLSQEDPDNEEYVLNTIDRSLSYDCKRMSQSYTILSETYSPNLNNRRLNGSASLGALNTICLENNKKSNKRRMFWTPKQKSSVVPPNGQKRGFFSQFRFRSNNNKESGKGTENEKDTNLHVMWYKPNNEQEHASDSRVHFRHSWITGNQKEIASSIAAELESKTKSKSLFLKNTDRLSILTEMEGKAKF